MSDMITIDKGTVKRLLASRKLAINRLDGLESVQVCEDKVTFESFQALNRLAEEITLPVGAFFEKSSKDLDGGVKIGRRSDTPDAQDYRKGSLYYTHHYLASTSEEPSLMALRVGVHCKKRENIELHKGHVCKELIYVSKGTIQVQWMNNEGKLREDVLNQGDSIFISSYTPHSYTALDSDEPAEIIAVNYA